MVPSESERLSTDKPIGACWVLRVKRKADGSIERYKGRVVAKGYSQRPGFDYTETFAPTAKWAALRTIFATAALRDMEIDRVCGHLLSLPEWRSR